MKRLVRTGIGMFALVLAVVLFQMGCSSPQLTGPQANPWSVKMTHSIMQHNPDIGGIDFADKPRWNYTYGLVFKAMWDVWEKTEDPAVLDYIERYYDGMINDQGEIQGYDITAYSLDMINPGKVLFALYNTRHKDKYRLAMQTLRQQMKDQPRTREGGFWHKQRYPHQMWLDGLYMASPFLAQYAVEFDESALFDDVANQLILMEKHARDPKTGLLYHGWDESKTQRWSDPNTGCSPNFWGRGMGWYAMALVDCLDFMPQNHKNYEDLIAITKRLFTALARYQDPKTGLWYQVVDQGGREGNYLESTCSCMFVYAMAKAVRHGYVDGSFLKVARKGYRGILKNFVTVDANGLVDIHRCCAVAGLGGDPYRDGSYEYYIGETIRDNDPKALGPFILASLEMEKL